MTNRMVISSIRAVRHPGFPFVGLSINKMNILTARNPEQEDDRWVRIDAGLTCISVGSEDAAIVID